MTPVSLIRAAVDRLVRHVDALVLAALSVVVVTPFTHLFVTVGFLPYVVGAVVVALVVNLACSRRSAIGPVALIGVAGLAVYLVVVVFHVVVPRPSELLDVWEGTTGSWADVLTASVPANASSRLVALPVLVAWLACDVGTLLALRTRSISAPLAPVLVAFVVALLFTGQFGVGGPVYVAVVVFLTLAVVLLRANTVGADGESSHGPTQGFGQDTHGRSLPIGQLRLGAALVAVIAVVATGLGAIVPLAANDDRVDVHDRYDPPLEVSDAVSPLAEIRSGLNDERGTVLFTVRFTGVPPGANNIDRVRTAVLDTYDGTVWGTDAHFARAGRDLSPGPTPAVPTVAIHQDYELKAYHSSFLPVLDRPRLIQGTDLGFDRVAGMLLTTATDRQGYRYSVDSQVPQYTDAEKRDAKPGNDPSVAQLALSPPDGWPAAMQQFAQQFGTAADSYDLLAKVESEFRSERFGYSPKARPGHSLAVLQDFLTAPSGGGAVTTARVGYAEQFAAAFAILARIEGLPSRVVVGYRVDPAAVARGDTISVLSTAVHAWPEVNLNGVGWVQFDPTNATDRSPVEPEATPPTTPPATPPATGPATTISSSTSVPGGQGGGQREDSLPLWPFVLPALILAVPAIVVGAKAFRRRRRRTRGTVAERALGAWLEARDELGSHGVPVSRSSTVTELAETCETLERRELASSVGAFASIVDSVLYAPDDPDDALAKEAWDAEESVTALLNEQAGPVGRARAAIDPRPLVPGRN